MMILFLSRATSLGSEIKNQNLSMFVFGIGKAALIPIHTWLPAAMVAPTPVSALLHAVAVVKAGVFTMLIVLTNVFGIDFLAKTGASEWLIWLASLTLLATSIIAIFKDDLKARLAYSTISQLSYITLGGALASWLTATIAGILISIVSKPSSISLVTSNFLSLISIFDAKVACGQFNNALNI